MINPAIEDDLKRMSLNDINYADYIKENYIQIPDNATNGDVIKALFPCLEKYEYEELYTHGIALAGNDNRVTWFANEWWNSPYKADK